MAILILNIFTCRECLSIVTCSFVLKRAGTFDLDFSLSLSSLIHDRTTCKDSWHDGGKRCESLSGDKIPK